MERPNSAELVKRYLRAQNLEQLGRTDEAIAHYEAIVEAGFDAIGPYDRLIALYSARALHTEVVRVADAALERVHTHDEKRAWYEQMRLEAHKALDRLPRAAPKKSS